jgi:hypothetical protein
MQEKWIKEIFNEKMIIQLSNPMMSAITGNPTYDNNNDSEEAEEIEMAKTQLRTLCKATQNLLMLFETKECEIEPWMQSKISNASYIISELNNYVSNKE